MKQAMSCSNMQQSSMSQQQLTAADICAPHCSSFSSSHCHK